MENTKHVDVLCIFFCELHSRQVRTEEKQERNKEERGRTWKKGMSQGKVKRREAKSGREKGRKSGRRYERRIQRSC